MIRKTFIVGAASLAMTVFGVVAGQSASAAPPSTCRPGYFCGFYYSNYTGDSVETMTSIANLATISHTGHGNWDNQFSSAYDYRSTGAYVYKDANYSGSLLYLGPTTGYASLATQGFGNSITSIRILQ